MKGKSMLTWLLRLVFLSILFCICFIGGSYAVQGSLPAVKSQPGLVSVNNGLLILSAVNTILVSVIILSSRWHGWKLAIYLALAYYGAVTFLMQVETWYFLSGLTVSEKLLPKLFLMGVPVAFVYIPLAVWILGKWQKPHTPEALTEWDIPLQQLIGKLLLVAIIYVLLYWCAGYFIAWQNPELRAFYGKPGPIVPFWHHTADTLQNDPWLIPFQLVRGLIWVLCAMPVIIGSKWNAWITALLVGLLFSLPQNIGHIIENPLLPLAGVRISHLVETAGSTFLFGLIVTWLLHRNHQSVSDLFGIKPDDNNWMLL